MRKGWKLQGCGEEDLCEAPAEAGEKGGGDDEDEAEGGEVDFAEDHHDCADGHGGYYGDGGHEGVTSQKMKANMRTKLAAVETKFGKTSTPITKDNVRIRTAHRTSSGSLP
jgi:hypothetical protein